MKFCKLLSAAFLIISFSACAQKQQKPQTQIQINNTKAMNKTGWNTLTPEEERVIVNKGTEYPGTGKLLNNTAKGTYVCKRCNAPLYSSDDKFASECGWPSFDDEIPGAIKRVPDADGQRTEIVCANCGGHLGHVFNDGPKETTGKRHCINGVALKFIPENE